MRLQYVELASQLKRMLCRLERVKTLINQLIYYRSTLQYKTVYCWGWGAFVNAIHQQKSFTLNNLLGASWKCGLFVAQHPYSMRMTNIETKPCNIGSLILLWFEMYCCLFWFGIPPNSYPIVMNCMMQVEKNLQVILKKLEYQNRCKKHSPVHADCEQ